MILDDLLLEMNVRGMNQYPTTSLLQWYGNLTNSVSCEARTLTRHDQGHQTLGHQGPWMTANNVMLTTTLSKQQLIPLFSP